mgnify:CR=1 FL=1
MKSVTSEHAIQKEILEFLAYNRIFAWRNNTGAALGTYVTRKTGELHKRYIRYGTTGSPDILGCLPDGKFLGIEVKRARGKLTIFQREFLDKLSKNNAVAFVAYDLDDVIRELRARKYLSLKNT